MEVLMICPTDNNRFAVRPAHWAGCWDSEGRIREDIRNTAIFEIKDDAQWYIDTKELDRMGLLIRLPEYAKDLDVKSLQYAIQYGISIVKYGVTLSPELFDNATKMSAMLNEAYLKGRNDERKRFEQISEER